VRLAARAAWAFGVLALWAAHLPPARAQQSPEVMTPEQSAAKAKDLLQQTIAALGGPAYLGVRDSNCTGRLALFGHSGDLTGYSPFRDLWKLPDKNRTEYSKKANIVDVYNGNQGWTLDRSGVQEASATALEEFQENLKRDIDILLRFRLKEDGMSFRYAGGDIVDLKQVDWVEIADRDRRTFRIAIDRVTRLPVRATVITRNPATRERTEEVSHFSSYHPIGGVQTPFQVERERNGLKVYQVFYTSCQYNTGLSDDLFTRAALEKRWAEVAPKKKK